MDKPIWEQLDNSTDLEGLKNDAKEAAEGGEYKEVPKGEYEVKFKKLELGQSKKGDPMMICWMEILKGDFKGQLIFYNQVLTGGFQIHLASEFLRSLDTGVDVSFEGYAHFNAVIEEIKASIDGQKLEYAIEYGENKGWDTFKITDVFEAE